MTVIAWDGKTLAADKRATYGDMICTVTKIARIEGRLAAGAGDTAFINVMFEWLRGGRVPAEFPKSQESKDDWQPFLVIESDGTPLLYERSPCPVRYEQKHIVLGSGREFARAALHLGKTAVEAVQCAIDLSHTCGNGIDTLTF